MEEGRGEKYPSIKKLLNHLARGGTANNEACKLQRGRGVAGKQTVQGEVLREEGEDVEKEEGGSQQELPDLND